MSKNFLKSPHSLLILAPSSSLGDKHTGAGVQPQQQQLLASWIVPTRLQEKYASARWQLTGSNSQWSMEKSDISMRTVRREGEPHDYYCTASTNLISVFLAVCSFLTNKSTTKSSQILRTGPLTVDTLTATQVRDANGLVERVRITRQTTEKGASEASGD